MPTDTITPTLVINKLTKAQYEGIANPSDTELYLVPEDEELDPHRCIEFQVPTVENGYTWYRKYADGWVEQGGIRYKSQNVAGQNLVDLPVEMGNYDFSIFLTRVNEQDSTTNVGIFAWEPTIAQLTTQIKIRCIDYAIGFYWRVEGMYATE